MKHTDPIIVPHRMSPVPRKSDFLDFSVMGLGGGEARKNELVGVIDVPRLEDASCCFERTNCTSRADFDGLRTKPFFRVLESEANAVVPGFCNKHSETCRMCELGERRVCT